MPFSARRCALVPIPVHPPDLSRPLRGPYESPGPMRDVRALGGANPHGGCRPRRSSCLDRKSSIFLARSRKQIPTLLYLSTSTTSAAQVIHWFGVARLQPRECKPQSNAESQEFSLVAPAGAPSHTGRILMSKSGNLVCKVVGLKALTLFHP